MLSVLFSCDSRSYVSVRTKNKPVQNENYIIPCYFNNDPWKTTYWISASVSISVYEIKTFARFNN